MHVVASVLPQSPAWTVAYLEPRGACPGAAAGSPPAVCGGASLIAGPDQLMTCARAHMTSTETIESVARSPSGDHRTGRVGGGGFLPESVCGRVIAPPLTAFGENADLRRRMSHHGELAVPTNSAYVLACHTDCR